MLATFAFDVCHDVYRAAREAIDSKIPTLNAEGSGKYQWRPDRMPRLAEYVCDFATLGERALEAGGGKDVSLSGFSSAVVNNQEAGTNQRKFGCRSLARRNRDKQSEGYSTGDLSAGPLHRSLRASPSPACGWFRASRMTMFRVYYLGGAEYQAARRHLGISELTWADWAEEIRRLAGREFARVGLFPPSKYFRESSVQCVEDNAEATAASEQPEQMASVS